MDGNVALWAALALGLAPSGPPASDAPERYSLRLDPCVDVDGNRLRTVLAVELGAPVTPAPIVGSTKIEIHCLEPGVMIRVETTRAERWVRRLVLPKTRARVRTLALAIAELIASRRGEIPKTQRPPASAKPRAQAKATPRASVCNWGASVGLTTRLVGAPLRPLVGLAATANVDLEWLSIWIDATAENGRSSYPGGSVTSRVASLALLVGLSAPAAMASPRLGIGYRGGGAWLRGHPRDRGIERGATVSGFWGGPAAALRLHLPSTTAALDVGVSLEGGWVTVPVRGLRKNEQVAALSGPWLGVGVTLGRLPP